MKLSAKQTNLLQLIVAGNPEGKLVDLDQLMERAEHKPSKAAIQFSIRTLIAHELIEKAGTEKRRERMRVLFKATELGQHFGAAMVKPEPQVVVSVEEDAAVSAVEETIVEII